MKTNPNKSYALLNHTHNKGESLGGLEKKTHGEGLDK